MPFISSDPHAWMRPYYEQVASREGFAQLAISIQFAALVDAIAVDYPAKAAKLRQIADLPRPARHVAVVLQRRLPQPGAALGGTWRVRKDGRELRCIAVYMPTGIDLRLMEGEDCRRT